MFCPYDLICEVLKSLYQRFHRTIVLHMLGVNVGDDGAIAVALKERTITFVAFDDKKLALTVFTVNTTISQNSTYGVGR